ncbi:MAG TPA: hypothetical protein VFF06_30605 [Polyangia bacterium]|nr:hypothetical protein [Polyangia bacterium]
MRALALLLLVASPALADDDTTEKAQARVLLNQGNALFEKGDLKGALVDFRAAYALYPSPKLLVNAAAAERELGDLVGAANDLRHFLDESDDDPFLVDRARTDLKALERRVGRVAIMGWPPRTTLEIDGRPAREPIVYVKPGGHVVRVRAPGGEAQEREIDVSPGESVDVPPVAGTASGPIVGRPGAPAKKSRWWIPVVVVASVVVVGGAVAVGLTLGNPSTGGPLKSDLGTFKFSDFH